MLAQLCLSPRGTSSSRVTIISGSKIPDGGNGPATLGRDGKRLRTLFPEQDSPGPLPRRCENGLESVAGDSGESDRRNRVAASFANKNSRVSIATKDSLREIAFWRFLAVRDSASVAKRTTRAPGCASRRIESTPPPRPRGDRTARNLRPGSVGNRATERSARCSPRCNAG